MKLVYFSPGFHLSFNVANGNLDMQIPNRMKTDTE